MDSAPTKISKKSSTSRVEEPQRLDLEVVLNIPLKLDRAYYVTTIQPYKTANLVKLDYHDPRSMYPKTIASWWVGKLVDQKDFTQYRFSDGLGIDVQEKLLALLDIENAKILPGK